MISAGQYTARSAFAGESRTAGQAVGTTGKKSAEADSFSKLVNDSADAGGTQAAAKSANGAAKSSRHFSFKDFILGLLDIINPLQHIPVVSTIYRNITGDEISPMARIAGDALYGGPIGAAVGIADVAVQQTTGKDIGENVMAMVQGDDKPRDADRTEVAAARKQDDIIWDDDMQQAAMKLTVHPRSEGGQSPRRDEMLKQRMNIPAAAQKTQPRHSITAPAADALLQAQQVPKDQIAQKMMEGLDKYRAMRGTGTAF